MALNIPSYDDFVRKTAVSRGTHKKLVELTNLLEKWQKSINLVSNASIKELWDRHILDSAQLFHYLKQDEAVVDLGSGGGFPGLVLAILGITTMTLVESDKRKVAFLREAARVTETEVEILNKRVEDISFQDYVVITSRGFASVKRTLELIENTLNPFHKLLLLKGKNYETEIKEAHEVWFFDTEIIPSATDKEGAVLILQNIQQRGSIP